MHKHRHVHQFVRINVRKKKGFLSSDCQIREFKIVISSNNLFFRVGQPTQLAQKAFGPLLERRPKNLTNFFFLKKGSPSTLSDLAVAGDRNPDFPSPAVFPVLRLPRSHRRPSPSLYFSPIPAFATLSTAVR